MSWLVASLVASVVLTVVLNLAVRLFPGATDRAVGRMVDRTPPDGGTDAPAVRVWFPWKAMLVASVVGTIVLNLLL